MRIEPVFLFDLDGTLVDSVYQHVLAWKEALDSEGIELSVWRIHRKIGMSGGLFTNQLLRETGVEIERGSARAPAPAACARLSPDGGPHPAACPARANCWPGSRDAGLPWAIATSGRMETAAVNLDALGVDPARTPVVTRDQVKYAKPDPDLFLAAAARLAPRSRRPSSSATASGTCWLRPAAARSVSDCCAAATARASFSRRRRFASTTIRPICLSTSMSSADGGEVSVWLIIAR